MRDIEEIRKDLQGAALDDIAIVLLEEVEALEINNPEYFANGRGNSFVHTLQMIINTVKEAA